VTDGGVPGPSDLADLRVPEVPSNVPYDDLEDVRARQLLEANGVEAEPPVLARALDSEIDTIAAAAARVLGADGITDAIPRLKELASKEGDTVRAEAAYALARMGEQEGIAALESCLELPAEAYVAPLLAAGSLARLGSDRGRETVARALESENSLIRMIAAKQLRAFADADLEAVLPLFERALADSDEGVRWEALVQLRELDDSRVAPLLEKAAREDPQQYVRQAAQAALAARD
jgi:HEAT repeat protein